MAEFEYEGGGEDLSGDGGSTRPFDSDGYVGFDPRLPSQRFDSSQRFDDSFRAPDHFHPTFGEDPKEEVEDEYKGANGFSYHQADTPPAYGEVFDNESAGRSTEVGPGDEESFEPDLESEYGQSGTLNTGAHGVNGNGFGANAEDDNLFSSLPPQQSDGPILPPPEDMKEEGLALREWKRENAIRLEEKERKEREKLAQVIEEARDYKEGLFAKRRTAIENGKKNNRDREKTYLANQENFHKDADRHYWKAVAELIPNELPTIDKGGKKDRKDKDKKPGIVAIKGPKPGKSTDLTRLRHVLVKLKHNPPPHMKYKPPPPPPAADKDKDTAKKDCDGKDKEPKKADGSTATTSTPSPPPGAAAVTA